MQRAAPPQRIEPVVVNKPDHNLAIQTVTHDVDQDPPTATVSYRTPTRAELAGAAGANDPFEFLAFPCQPPHDDLFCNCCYGLLHDAHTPVNQENCDHVYCKACWDMVQLCPECRTPKTALHPARSINNQTDDMLVHCHANMNLDTSGSSSSSCTTGTLRDPPPCPWTGPLHQLGEHSANCVHLPVMCTAVGCTAVHPRGQRDEHRKTPEHLEALVAVLTADNARAAYKLEQLAAHVAVMAQKQRHDDEQIRKLTAKQERTDADTARACEETELTMREEVRSLKDGLRTINMWSVTVDKALDDAKALDQNQDSEPRQAAAAAAAAANKNDNALHAPERRFRPPPSATALSSDDDGPLVMAGDDSSGEDMPLSGDESTYEDTVQEEARRTAEDRRRRQRAPTTQPHADQDIVSDEDDDRREVEEFSAAFTNAVAEAQAHPRAPRSPTVPHPEQAAAAAAAAPARRRPAAAAAAAAPAPKRQRQRARGCFRDITKNSGWRTNPACRDRDCQNNRCEYK
jgi:predicted  nucleic acid-binding Zn-ribbon protein